MNSNNYINDDDLLNDEDLHTILKLMEEYTRKLREICEFEYSSKYRQFQIMTLSLIAILLGFFAIAGIILTSKENIFASINYQYLFGSMFVGVVAFFIIGVFYISPKFFSPRLRYAFDAMQLARNLEHIIKMASQYQEHAGMRIGDKFEFELRLAEAEGALHMYKVVYPSDKKEFY